MLGTDSKKVQKYTPDIISALLGLQSSRGCLETIFERKTI
jgi:hypothetical protein